MTIIQLENGRTLEIHGSLQLEVSPSLIRVKPEAPIGAENWETQAGHMLAAAEETHLIDEVFEKHNGPIIHSRACTCPICCPDKWKANAAALQQLEGDSFRISGRPYPREAD